MGRQGRDDQFHLILRNPLTGILHPKGGRISSSRNFQPCVISLILLKNAFLRGVFNPQETGGL